METGRLAAQRRSLPFFDWYSDSPHQSAELGDGRIDLLFGNPQDMPIPAYVDALRRHLEPKAPDWFAYTLNEPVATAVVAEGLARHTGLQWEPRDVAITNGGWAAIGVAIRMLTEPGDEVVFFDPPWFFYEVTIQAADAVPVSITLEPPRFSPDPRRLAEAITPRTRAVLINSPHNPTGRVLLAEELESVAEVLRDASARYGRPIYLLSDEAYRRIVFDGRRAASPAEHYGSTIVLYSYGKQLLAPGQRIGYLALSPRIDEAERATLRAAVRLTQLVSDYSFANALLQRALPDIADLCVDIDALQRRRDVLVPALTEQGYEPTNPEGTFYVLARSPDADDVAFVAELAAEGLFVLPGSTVSLPGWFRISLTGSDAMIEAAIDRFGAARRGSGRAA
jgi:aspartate aminotransferase